MPRTYSSTVVEASADTVWRAIRDFHDVSWAPGVLTSCEAVGERKGDQIGAGRVLNGCFRETLLALDDRHRTIEYCLEDGPSPVSPGEVRDFVAVVRVRPMTDSGHAFVEWSASWEASDESAVEFAGGTYSALLDALKKSQAAGGGSSRNG